MDDVQVITFDPPLEWNNTTYPSITVTEPTLGNLIEMEKEKTDLGRLAKLISLASNTPLQVVYKMPARQMKEASDFINRFTNPSPATGEP